MQAFLDRDGAVGSLMGFKGPTWVWGHGDSWLGHGDLKLGPCSDFGPFKKKTSDLGVLFSCIVMSILFKIFTILVTYLPRKLILDKILVIRSYYILPSIFHVKLHVPFKI